MTIEATTFAPSTAMIAAGLFVYFQTASFSREYGPRVEKVRVVLLGRILERTEVTHDLRKHARNENPYFPEAGYDEMVIKSLVASEKAEDYRRCVGTIRRGNSLLRCIGLGMVAIGVELFPFLVLYPELSSFMVFAVIVATAISVIVWFAKYHRLVHDIDLMDASAYLGSPEVPWRR